ncbi:hypothetical protein EGW08_008999 [Elysia chlorotica]|uniref:Uncharacterized protein n=1 Tax=Elysia chlorotica TaxID=188477 RepID=A0A3S0ZUM3_ELYCH|nr:hypothetical protein EGW08_008999 [Elysia chlorotica]
MVLDDDKYFRRIPNRYLGYGLALSNSMTSSEDPLTSMFSLVGQAFVIARVVNKALIAQKDKKTLIPIVADTIVFEGVATIILPSLIVQWVYSAIGCCLTRPRFVALAVSISALMLLQEKIDSNVSDIMDQTIRGGF